MAKRNYPKPVKNAGLGYLPTPHGPTPWHFRHEAMVGNGFNGVIRHMWRNPSSMWAMPGLGLMAPESSGEATTGGFIFQ